MRERLPGSPRSLLLAAAGAFAAGVQVRLLLRSGFGSYPPPGAEGLAWSTLLLLAGVAMVAASRVRPQRIRRGLSAAGEAATQAVQAAAGAAAELDGGSGSGAATGVEPSPQAPQPPRASLGVRLETPFDEAPAVAPGEDVPVRVAVEAAGLEGPVRLRLSVREGEARRVRTVDLEGSTMVRSVSFEEEGPVEVAATVDHPEAEAATARVQGRCQPYRDAVGDLLEELREEARRRGLDAGPGATPRRTCRAFPGGPTDALRDRLEAALYGDAAVTREAYLEVHRLQGEVLEVHRGETP